MSTSSSGSTLQIDEEYTLFYLKKVMRSFNKADLFQALISFEVLQPDTRIKSITKVQIMNEVCRHTATLHDMYNLASDLDITSVIRYQKKKMWRVYAFRESPVAHLTKHDEIKVAELLREKLIAEYDIISLDCMARQSAFWTRIALSRRRRIHCFYIVLFPGHPFLFLSGGDKAMEKSVLMGFCKIQVGQSYEALNLSGKDLYSLLQLAVQRNNHAVIHNPNSIPNIFIERLQKQVEEEHDVFMDRKEVKLRKRIFRIFGRAEPPVLTSSTFVFQTPYYTVNPPIDHTITQISFKSKNVIQTIRKMTEQKLITKPIRIYEELAISGCHSYEIVLNQD